MKLSIEEKRAVSRFRRQLLEQLGIQFRTFYIYLEKCSYVQD